MKKEQIQQVYKIAETYFMKSKKYQVYYEELSKDLIQIALQICYNGEVIYNEDGSVKRIE